jgi:RNA polymerase sigma factor (sigma-70 family)
MRPHEHLRRLVEANRTDILSFLIRRVASSDDAADLFGETLLVIWRRVSDVPANDTEARMWMFGIAKGVLLNYDRGRRRHLALADRLREELRVSASENDPSAIRDAIADLPEPLREIVRLIHWDGFSQVDVGQILGIPASTVHSRYATARALLHTALSEIASPVGRTTRWPIDR